VKEYLVSHLTEVETLCTNTTVEV